MMDRRIHELPLTGKVVLANPVNEWPAQKVAASEDLPYFLSPNAPVGGSRGLTPGAVA